MYKRKKINPNPQNIDKFNWFYDRGNYLEFIHEVRDKNGNFIQTDIFKVKINKLSNFLVNLQ